MKNLYLIARWLFGIPLILASGDLAAYSGVASTGRFSRGTGNDPTFHSFVIPVDGQRGVALDSIGGNAMTYFINRPWTNLLYHLDATNVANQDGTMSGRIAFENPIAAFGSRVGGSSLYATQSYSFGVYAGDLSSQQESELIIRVFDRTNMVLLQTTNVSIPQPSQNTEWSDFLTNGNTKAVTIGGLTTTLAFTGIPPAWGVGTNRAVRLTHRGLCAATGYVFEIGLCGRTVRGAMVLDMDERLTSCPLYTLEFDNHPKWRPRFVDNPHFEGEPMPSEYAGKSVEELERYSKPVTNQLSLTSPTIYTNLNWSPELRQHPILDDFVQELRSDPIALANYVYNEIDLTDAVSFDDTNPQGASAVNSGGINRGALATFQEGQGSPTEQCALLVYFLRRAGVPAVYVYAPQNGVKLLDSRLSKLLRMQLKRAVDETGHSSVPELIPVNYPWVAAWTGTNWVHLFPWLKDTEIVEGLNLYDYMPPEYDNGYKWLRAYLYGGTNILSLSSENTPATLFPKFIQQQLLQTAPGISLDDIGVRVRNRRHHYTRWSDFPTPTQVTNVNYAVESLAVITNTFPAWTNIFDTVSVEIASVSQPTNRIYTGEWRTLDLHNRQFVLYYQPASGNKHKMILSLAPFHPAVTNRLAFAAVNPQSLSDTNVLCQLATTNTLTSAENDLRLRVTSFRRQFNGGIHTTNLGTHLDTLLGFEVTQPFSQVESATQERMLRKGDLVALCLNLGRASPKMVNEHARKFWALQQLVADDPRATNRINIENYQGALTYLLGMTYFDRVGRFKAMNERLHKVSTISWYGVGLSSLAAYRKANGILPAGDIKWVKPRLDILENQIAYAANGTLRPDLGESLSFAIDDFFQLFLADSSAQEHETINSYFRQGGAISTVKLLQLSETGTNCAGPGILELTLRNYKNSATNRYGGTALKDFDPQMWASISNAFTENPASNFVQVFITSGWVTNTTGRQMGALVLGGEYYTALISTNLNGGEGEGLASDLFDLSEFANLSLDACYSGSDYDYYYGDYGYDDDWSDYGEEDYSWDYSLSYTAPSLSRPYDFPSQVASWNLDWTLSQAEQNYYQYSSWQQQSLDAYRFSVGLPSRQPDTDTFWYQKNVGNLGGTSSYKDWMTWTLDPVNVMNGEFYIDAVDLTIPGTMPLEIRRSYGSHNLADNQFGYGWKLSYFPWLVLATNNSLIYAAEMDGSVVAYRLETNGVWRPKPADNPQLHNQSGADASALRNMFNARLEQQVTGGGTGTNYVLFGPDGSRRVFRVQSFPIGSLDRRRPYLEKWEDSRGNYYLFSFGDAPADNDYGQLKSVASSSGARASLYYDPYGHVTEIYSADGRRVRYSYNRYGDLAGVILPDASEIQYEYQPAPSTNKVVNDVYGWVWDSVNDLVYFPRDPEQQEYVTIERFVVLNGSTYWPPDPLCDGEYVEAYNEDPTYYFKYQGTSQLVNVRDDDGYYISFWRSGLIHPYYTQPGLHRDAYWRNTFGFTEPDLVRPMYQVPDPYYQAEYVSVTTNGYFWRKTGTSTVAYQDEVSTHLLITETKPDGRILQNQYDEQNRVTNQLATVGVNLAPVRNGTFVYVNDYGMTNDFTNTISGHTLVIDGLGHTTRYDYTKSLLTGITDPLQQSVIQDWYEPSETNKTGYCAGSLEITKDKRDLWTKFYYDSKGNVVSNIVIGDVTGNGRRAANHTEAELVAASSSVPAPGEVEKAVRYYTYRSNSTPATATDATGVMMSWSYDDTNYAYLPTRVVRSSGIVPISTNQLFYTNVAQVVANGAQVVTNLSCGLPWREVRPGSTTDRAFDGRGFPVRMVAYTGTTDPDVTSSFVYNPRGELVEQADPARILRYDYDAAGRRQWQEVWEPGGTFPAAWQRSYFNENGEQTWSDGSRFNPEDYVWRDYDGGGRLTVEIRWRSQAKPDGSGVEALGGYDLYSQTFYEYDVFGNLTRTIDPRGAITTNSWDALGRLIRRESYDSDGVTLLTGEGFAYEPGGQVAFHTNALGGVTEKQYTSLGQIRYQKNPDGSTSGWRYYRDGRVATNFLSNGAYWYTTYDDANRSVRRTFSQDAGNVETSVYDRRGNLILTTNAVGGVFTNFYDGLDRLKFAGGPGTVSGVSTQQVTTYFYDASGSMLVVSNALGEKTVTTYDALARPLTVAAYAAGGLMVSTNRTIYSADHHHVMTIAGSGGNAITNTVFTDTFGNVVLSQSFPGGGVVNYRRNAFDAAGNLVLSRDELDQITTWDYDGLNRVITNTLPDRAVTTFRYNAAGSLTNRTMPGGLVWSAAYDAANRLLAEQRSRASTTSITNGYVYYNSGPYVGQLQTVTDGRGVTRTTSTYDALLRAVQVDCFGPLEEHKLHLTFSYNRRGRLETLDQQYDSGFAGTTVRRGWTGYDQLGWEEGQIELTSETLLRNTWDAAGRRSSLAPDPVGRGRRIFGYRADGLMTSVTANAQGYHFTYADNGLLASRSNPFRTMTVNQRDGRGRLKQQTITAGASTPLVETFNWRANSTLDDYTAARGFTDFQDYSYNSRNQLTNATMKPSASGAVVNTSYGIATQSGVLTSVTQSGGLTNSWVSGRLDGLMRVMGGVHTLGGLSLRASGLAAGAGSVSALLDGNPVGVTYPGHTNGSWFVDLTLAPGAHQLAATAHHPNGFYHPAVTNAFSVLADEMVFQNYDGAGYMTNRVFPDGRVQSLAWDALGRLVRVTERIGAATNYVWSAVYDGLGRRVRTVNNPGGTNSPSSLTLDSWFDPQVEFLEVAVELNNVRTWKVYGPDVSGGYGALQGVGGLEATVQESDGATVGLLNDHFGNALATRTGGAVVWSPTRVDGYGPVKGYVAPTLTLSTPLAEATVWRGQRVDPTGYYWLGARYYDFLNARFISVDPLGHAASMDLYSAFNGDPINYFDPDGRLGKQAWNYSAGTTKGFLQGYTGIYVTPPANQTEYLGQQFGRNAAGALALWLTVSGSANTGTGLGTMAASAYAEAASGGFATVVAGPAFIAGGAMTLEGLAQTGVGVFGLHNFNTLTPLDQPCQPQGSLHPDAGPYADPNPPEYGGGHTPDEVVIDHQVNRARAPELANEPSNRIPRDWESNARKGGFEGNLAKDIETFKQNWRSATGREPTPEEIRFVFKDEIKWIENDAHARPVDPKHFEGLPAPRTKP